MPDQETCDHEWHHPQDEWGIRSCLACSKIEYWDVDGKHWEDIE